ncbi:hypothetical protein N9D32_02095 [Candidatus Pelagibacter sp.]|nr:hypothetical protein [Candidatus Pelagibacter ubique]MDA9957245.1 hypothetical protein [Candidatus Pelagibacter sp.]
MSKKKPFTTGPVLGWWLLTSFVLFINFDIWFGDEKWFKLLFENSFAPIEKKWFWVVALLGSIAYAIDHLGNKR